MAIVIHIMLGLALPQIEIHQRTKAVPNLEIQLPHLLLQQIVVGQQQLIYHTLPILPKM